MTKVPLGRSESLGANLRRPAWGFIRKNPISNGVYARFQTDTEKIISGGKKCYLESITVENRTLPKKI